MKKPIKRILAKEIIFFFSSVVIVGLVCLVLLCINELRINKSQKLKVEISHLSNSVDSLKEKFSRTQTLEEIIVGVLPEQYKKSHSIKLNTEGYDFSAFDSILQSKNNINDLYDLLLASDYRFKLTEDGWVPKEVFCQSFGDELLNLNPRSNSQQERIYKFLKDRNYINVSFYEFINNLNGFSFASEKLGIEFINKKKEIETAKASLNNTNGKIFYGDYIEDVALSTFLLLMVIIYPIRLIVISVIWAIRTLKEKPNIE